VIAPGRRGDRSLSDRVVGALSRALGGATWSRRSFLVQTSVVGSAVALDLKGFALTPGSAMAHVCGPLNECGDAFTAFCCTINHGANLCPADTFVGGWWKADRSAFCRGAARYYVDCNGSAGSHWRCHCSESATCDKRKVACNVFRYGNCNLDVSVSDTAVVCRVITCTPPWEWDQSCTETSFTDDLTSLQTAPCLPAPWSSPVLIKWSDLGGAGGPLGPQKGQPRSLTHDDGIWAEFRRGAVFDVKWLGVFAVEEPAWAAVKDVVGRDGIGYPANDATPLDEDGAWQQLFVNRQSDHQREDAAVVGTPALGTHVVSGPVLSKWHALGAEDGVLGFPTSDTRPTYDHLGLFSTFAKLDHGHRRYDGAIYVHPSLGAHEVHGVIYEEWRRLGGSSGPLGFPSSDRLGLGVPGAHLNDFATVGPSGVLSRGAIVTTQQLGTFGIWGLVHARWVADGAQHGPLGFPSSNLSPTPDGLGVFATFRPLGVVTPATGGGVVLTESWGAWALLGTFFTTWLSDQRGPRVLGEPSAMEVDEVVGGLAVRTQRFSSGAIYDSSVGRDCVLYGPILQQYLTDGGTESSLGLPTSSVVTLADGDEQATFVGGTLTYVPGSGVSQS
jgi:uncharacterized protein with LGFP repeats